MREIKFRAWFPGPNVMGKVTNLKGSNVGYEFNGVVAECFIDGRQVFYEAYENFALMQFTGLKDKNGKEIYEGDLITWYDDNIFTVVWSPNTLAWARRFPDGLVAFLNESFGGNVEIVGNIYQNPELLQA